MSTFRGEFTTIFAISLQEILQLTTSNNNVFMASHYFNKMRWVIIILILELN